MTTCATEPEDEKPEDDGIEAEWESESPELRSWFDSLSSLVAPLTACYIEQENTAKGGPKADNLPAEVRRAMDRAAVAAFDALARLAGKVGADDELPTFRIDLSRFGRDE